tara:strand:+ start:23 stop:586 length:564 start_codon:yes stop_codon:yes gene_type:complete
MEDYNNSLDNVNVYQNLIPHMLASDIIDFLYDTTWTIGWSDKGWYDTDADAKYFHHSLINNVNGQMVPDRVFGEFLECIQASPAWEENDLDKLSISSAVANCISMADITYKHTHHFKKALVYHANLEWKAEWGGELLYYDRTGKKVEEVFEYIPGQILIHDGPLVHHLKPPYKNGPKFRFSFGVFFA